MLEGIKNRDQREVVDQWWANELNIPNLTPRWVLQHFGTDLFRKFSPNFWITIVKRKLRNYDKVVITDCRFDNEISMIRELGGVLICVNRDISNNSTHDSEKEWINANFDYTLNNNSSIEKLHAEVDNILANIE